MLPVKINKATINLETQNKIKSGKQTNQSYSALKGPVQRRKREFQSDPYGLCLWFHSARLFTRKQWARAPLAMQDSLQGALQ